LATHQKAAPPLQAPDACASEAPLCIRQRPLRADPCPPCQPALEVRQQMWRGHPALAPRSEASRPPGLTRRRDRKGWSPSPPSRLGPLQTECHNPPQARRAAVRPFLRLGVRWNGVAYLLSPKKQAIAKNRWNGSDPQKGTVCYSGSIYSNHPVSPMLPPLSSTSRPAAAQETSGSRATGL
jgi:hypothetical protein